MSAEIPKIQDRSQEVAASIQNVDAMSGYIAGMSAKSAVETALNNGRVNFVEQDIIEANNYGNNLGIDEPKTDAERAMFEAATEMSNNGVDLTQVSKVSLTEDYKIGDRPNDEVIGFLLGYIAHSPNLTSSQRTAIVNSGPDDTRPRGTDFQSLKGNLEYCLGEAVEGKADPAVLLPSIPREFGMRDAVTKLISEPAEEKARLLSLIKGEKQATVVDQQVVDTGDADETLASANVVSDTGSENEVEQPEKVTGDKDITPEHLVEIEEELGEVAVEEVVDEPSGVINQAVVEEELDPGEIDISQYLSDPETLVKTLRDRDIDPGLRADLRKVVTVWQELQHSELAKTLWEGTIAPRLDKLNTIGLKDQANSIVELRTMLDGYQNAYRGLANLLREPRVGMGDIAEYLRRHDMGESALEQIKTQTKGIAQDETPRNMVNALGLDTEDADIMVKKLGRKIGNGEIEPEEAEKFISDMQQQGVFKRKDLQLVAGDLVSQVKFEGWRTLVGNVEDLMYMAKRGTNELRDGSLTPMFKGLERVFHDFSDLTRSGKFDSELANEVSVRAARLSEELERPLRLNRISSDEASWLTR